MDHASISHFVHEKARFSNSQNVNSGLGFKLTNRNQSSAGYRSLKNLAYDFKLFLSYLNLPSVIATKTTLGAFKLVLQLLSKRFIGHVQNLTSSLADPRPGRSKGLRQQHQYSLS